MRIGFIVNDVKTEEGKFTTSRLGQAAINRGHEVWVIGVGDLAYDPDGMIRARATSVPREQYGSSETYTADLQGKNAVKRRIALDELDVLMLRNVPSDDYLSRPWAATAAAEFARVAMQHGVIVLSDPNGLTKASSKMYFQLFPEEVRPRDVDHAGSGRNQAFCPGRGDHCHQAAAGFGRRQRVPGPQGGYPQPEPDDRRGQP